MLVEVPHGLEPDAMLQQGHRLRHDVRRRPERPFPRDEVAERPDHLDVAGLGTDEEGIQPGSVDEDAHDPYASPRCRSWIPGHVGIPLRVVVLAADGERRPHAIISRRRRHLAVELRVDATSHRFRKGNTEPAGVTRQSPVLIFGKLYLGTHHDVINITSPRRRGSSRAVPASLARQHPSHLLGIEGQRPRDRLRILTQAVGPFPRHSPVSTRRTCSGSRDSARAIASAS